MSRVARSNFCSYLCDQCSSCEDWKFQVSMYFAENFHFNGVTDVYAIRFFTYKTLPDDMKYKLHAKPIRDDMTLYFNAPGSIQLFLESLKKNILMYISLLNFEQMRLSSIYGDDTAFWLSDRKKLERNLQIIQELLEE